MPRYQVTAPDGRIVTVEGDTPPTDADLDGIFASLPATEAAAPAKKDPADLFRRQLETAGSFGATPQPEEMPEGAMGKLALAGTIASLPLGVQMAGAPIAAAKGLGLGILGSAAGGAAGKGIGVGLEAAGAPEGTSEVAGGIGGLVGGLAGPLKGPLGLLKLAELSGGKGGMLAALARKALPEVAESGAAQATGAAATQAAEREAAKAAEKAAAMKLRERALAVAEERNALLKERLRLQAEKVTAKAGPRAVPKPAPAPATEGATALKPEPELIPDEAVSLVAEPLPFKPRGTTMPTNLGGKAKPGPAATPEVDLEDVLRRSVEAAKARKAGAAVPTPESPLRAPRVQEGAQRVGKGVGMTKEEVRTATGPLLGEKIGEASPIIPKEPWERIVETMKSLPKTGGAREAYVAKAAPGKNRGQVEQLRRTLEQLGLLLPIGAGGVAISSD